MEHKTYHGRPVIWSPQPRQAAFMARTEDEALYGGAAGGGKSDALIIEALRQVHIPHYRALILRKTYPQLSELIDKTMRYYKPVFPKARYNGSSHCWTFPSGAKIYFGSLNHTQDKYNYQGKAFDFIGVDELTHFTWDEYSYVMSRNRPSGPGTRVYIRATANPGGVGHGWVKARFISPAPAGTRMVQLVKVKAPDGEEIARRRTRIFIPSTVFDNPALLENDPGYIGTLASLPEAEKQALLYGNWDSFSGQVFTECGTTRTITRTSAGPTSSNRFPSRNTGRYGGDTTSVSRSRFLWGGMQRTSAGGSTASRSFTAAPAHPTRA